MDCNFRVGQKVVCVDDDLYESSNPDILYYGGLDGLTRGEVYTIDDVYFDWFEGAVRVCVSEIERDFDDILGRKAGYGSFRFRPIQSTDKGMSILRGLLNTKPADKRVKEDA